MKFQFGLYINRHKKVINFILNKLKAKGVCQIIGIGKLPQFTADYCRLRYQQKTVESRGGTQWTHVTCRILPYSTRVIKLTNHDFPSLGQKIAIGSLSASALAILKISIRALPLTHNTRHLSFNPYSQINQINLFY